MKLELNFKTVKEILKNLNLIFLTSNWPKDYWIQDMDEFNWSLFLFMICAMHSIFTCFVYTLYFLVDKAYILWQKCVIFHSRITIMSEKLPYESNVWLVSIEAYWEQTSTGQRAQSEVHLVNSFSKANAVFEHLSCFLQLLKNHEESQQILRQTHTTHVLGLTALKSKIHLVTPALVWAVSQHQHLLGRHTTLI